MLRGIVAIAVTAVVTAGCGVFPGPFPNATPTTSTAPTSVVLKPCPKMSEGLQEDLEKAGYSAQGNRKSEKEQCVQRWATADGVGFIDTYYPQGSRPGLARYLYNIQAIGVLKPSVSVEGRAPFTAFWCPAQYPEDVSTSLRIFGRTLQNLQETKKISRPNESGISVVTTDPENGVCYVQE